MKYITLVFMICLSACFATPLIDSFHKSGLNADARKDLFPKTFKAFYNEVVGSRFLNFDEFLVEEHQFKLVKQLRESRKVEKIVGGKLDFVDFNKAANKAVADVIVEYYKVPTYIVNERIERQTWIFTGPNTGWQLKSIELAE
jgi:hypothetical protein